MRLKKGLTILTIATLLTGCNKTVVKPTLCSSFEKPLDLSEDEKVRLQQANISREWLINVRVNKEIINNNCFK